MSGETLCTNEREEGGPHQHTSPSNGPFNNDRDKQSSRIDEKKENCFDSTRENQCRSSLRCTTEDVRRTTPNELCPFLDFVVVATENKRRERE